MMFALSFFYAMINCPLLKVQMIEGVPAFHPKAPGDVAQMICLEGIRPILKTKSKAYPPDLNEYVFLHKSKIFQMYLFKVTHIFNSKAIKGKFPIKGHEHTHHKLI